MIYQTKAQVRKDKIFTVLSFVVFGTVAVSFTAGLVFVATHGGF